MHVRISAHGEKQEKTKSVESKDLTTSKHTYTRALRVQFELSVATIEMPPTKATDKHAHGWQTRRPTHSERERKLSFSFFSIFGCEGYHNILVQND